MYTRNLSAHLQDALSDTPVVLLVGARQSGKTTLVRSLDPEERHRRYLSLDDPTVVAAAQNDPVAFLSDLRSPVVLDEVQQAPKLFPALRSVVDRDRRPGRFLLTGSTHVMTIPRLSEALVGRMEILELWPLSQGEIEGRREDFPASVFAEDLPDVKGDADSRGGILRRALAGGYPEPLARKGRRRMSWFRSYVSTLLKREVRDLARIEGLSELPRLLQLLAARTASLMNFSEISRSSGIPQTTLKRYFALFEQTFLLHRLPAWSGNLSKRVVKSPKLHFCDTGLLTYLAGWTPETLGRHPREAGPLLENFVVQEIAKQAGWGTKDCRLYHFRTPRGKEVDIVLEHGDGRIVGVEVKARASLDSRDFTGLRTLAEVSGDRFHRGIVLYTGSEQLSFGPSLHALPLDWIWRLEAQ